MGVTMLPAELAAAEEAVRRALAEDLGPDGVDLTAVALEGSSVEAVLVAREAGVLCGLGLARSVFEARGVTDWELPGGHADGDTVSAGTEVARISGGAAAVLSAERVALNFLQQLSGTATLTRRYVDATAGTRASILDTRKTVPGMRALQRYAVRCGGGVNHRFGLFDAAMVKDNHIDAVGIPRAVELIRAAHPGRDIVVETRDLEEVRKAVAARADVVLLDNMDLATMEQAVQLVGEAALTEASGGISLQTVGSVAQTGVDRISVGALTHSARALDLALEVSAPHSGK
jgi:nicotinate-nucleotide pyrophosphorylase (carboxylating)